MKIQVSFIIVAFVFCLLVSSLPAQDASRFGYVNIVQAVMLHPLMAKYNVEAQAFQLSALKGEHSGKVSERKESSTSKIQELKSKIEGINEEKRDLEARRQKSMQTSKKEKTAGEPEEDTDLELFLEYQKLSKENKYLQTEISRLESSLRFADFTIPSETTQVFSLILDDVYEAVEAVSNFYKISFVFNSSFNIARVKNINRSNNPLSDFFTHVDKDIESGEQKIIMGGAIRNWIDSYSKVLFNCSDGRLSSFVVKGGLNMTPAVVDYVFQKHNIGKLQRDFIHNFFEKAMN